MTKTFPRLPLATLMALALGCNSFEPQVPARGSVLGRKIDTHVDSQMAAHYLEQLDEAVKSPHLAAGPLASLPRCAPPEPGAPVLRDIAERHSVDVASLHAAACLINANRDLATDFQSRFDEHGRGAHEAQASTARQLAGLTILFVPGWDYEESGGVTGADFAQQRGLFAQLGVKNTLAPLDPTGSVEENAEVISREMSRLSRNG